MERKNIVKKSFNNLLIFTFLILGLLFTLYFTKEIRKKELTYNEFVSELSNKDIEYIEIEQNKNGKSGTAYIIYEDSGFTANEYLYNTSDIASLLSYLEENKIDFIIKKLPKENMILAYILPALLILQGVILIVILIQLRGATSSSSPMNFGKSKANRINTSTLGFKDVAGLKEEKEDLEEIVDFLKHKEKYIEMGARIPKGILLVGPPGTGKTLLAKAIAGEAGVPFFSISGSDFVEMFVGVGAARVRDLFAEAKANSPCIVFIDEIDAVARKRGSGLGGSHDEREQTLNQMLVEMDGFSENNGIIVLAATNRVDILDPAILRPKRFDRKISVGKPDILGREEILRVHAKNKLLAEDVDLKDLARTTQGLTGADLENLLNESAIISARKSKKFITNEDVQDAFIKNFIGTEKKSRVIPESERVKTAYHEAGHAILFRELEHVGPVHTISIIPNAMGAAGYTMPQPKDDNLFETKESLFNIIKVSLGGRIAEEIVFSDVTTGASGDIKDITQKARAMVTRFGMSEKLGMINYESDEDVLVGRDFGRTKSYSEATASLIDEEVKAIIDRAYIEAKEIIISRRDILDKTAKLLLEKEKIGFDEFEALFDN